MLPTEQARFFETINRFLSAYGKFPEQRELEGWWIECKGLSLDALESALKSHKGDQERGERAPRPIDITRRMKAGARDAQRCAAADQTGQCEYPGIFSDGTSGEGPWHCPWHRTERAGPEASRWIDISRNVPYETARAKRMDRMTEDGKRTSIVVGVAHAIALRHGSRRWQTGLSDYLPREEEAA